MGLGDLALILSCVAMISLGQVLFKYVGLNIADLRSFLDLKVALTFFLSLVVYGFATLLWIHVLRSVPLTRAYPFMATAFLVVPLLSVWFFGESINIWYFVGTAFIIAGVLLINLTN